MNSTNNKPEITFEFANFIKEKGFDEICMSGFNNSEGYQNSFIPDFPNKNSEGIVTSAPEAGTVIKWLREKFGIWVWIRPYKDHAADNNDPFEFQMNVWKRGVNVSKEFKSYDEAIQGAFDYIKTMGLI
jgi:hypothetical protein